jgi:hypothetical protein
MTMKWAGSLSALVAALSALVVVASAQGAQRAAPGVQVSVLSTFPAGGAPTSAAATNQGDVVVPAAGKIVRVGPDGQQNAFPVALPLGAFGIGPIGIAYDTTSITSCTPRFPPRSDRCPAARRES